MKEYDMSSNNVMYFVLITTQDVFFTNQVLHKFIILKLQQLIHHFCPVVKSMVK